MPTAVELGVPDVLTIIEQRYGIEGHQRGDEYDILCPDPAHSDRRPSCSVNLSSGLWKCLSCGKAGDLISLGSLTLGEPYEAVRRSLKPSTPEALTATVQTRLGGLLRRPERVRAASLTEYRNRFYPTELLDRGYTHETLTRWGVRYVESDLLQGKTGPFTIANSVAIPIRDVHNHLLAWCYRRTEVSPTWQPRYLYTPTISLNDVWFGLQHHSHARDIAVVEGALDAMWLDQCGIPALALLGSEMGRRKLVRLGQYQRVTLFGDNDSAGALAVQRIGKAIGNTTSVRVVTYPKRILSIHQGKVDPGKLHPVDIELLVAQAQPWTTWLAKTV